MTPARRQLEKALSEAKDREAVARKLGCVPGQRGNKYNAQRTQVDGVTFDSKHEAKRYGYLKMLERIGEITDLKLQVPLMLEGKLGPLMTRTGQPMRLTVDFTYFDTKTEQHVWEDAKGKPTPDYEVRKAVAQAMGVVIHEV